MKEVDINITLIILGVAADVRIWYPMMPCSINKPTVIKKLSGGNPI